MDNIFRVFTQRTMRFLKNDIHCPNKCYISMYHPSDIPYNADCDCKNFCKFPPKGGRPLLLIKEFDIKKNDMYYINNNDKRHYQSI